MTLPDAEILILCPIIFPFAGGILCFLLKKNSYLLALSITVSTLVSCFFLLASYLISGQIIYHIGGWSPPLGIALRADGPAVLMLCLSTVSGLGITIYARGYFLFRIRSKKHRQRHQQQQQFFWPLWMLLLASLNSLFLANDIFNLYVALELISISATVLTALSGKPASLIAAFRYLLVSLLGSLTYLLGVLFLYKTYGVLDLHLLANAASAGPGLQAGLVLMSIGLLIKSALFPLHFWLPPAHANALAPVSAILSGLVVKGSIYLMFRLWLDLFQPVVNPNILELIGILGASAILWGGIQAIRQQRLKLMIAYSTVSQLGYLFIAFPLVYYQENHLAWTTVITTALAHGFAKSAMFMVAGSIFLQAGHDRIKDLTGFRSTMPITVFAFAIAGVNLMGLPPSGGFIGKWLMLSLAISTAKYYLVIIIFAGSIAASIYIYRVISRLFVEPEGYSLQREKIHSPLLEWPALIMAIFSLIIGISASAIHHILAGNGSEFIAAIMEMLA